MKTSPGTTWLSAYDAVIYATGAMRDRRLGIPGEDLPGSYAATDFVNWYCGHPDMESGRFTLDAESVAVIGVGNVAVDVARILARDPEELHATDVPQPVLEALRASKVREVHMIGRRGPAYAKFTTKELRELGELPGVEVVVHADEADLNAFDLAGEGAALVESDRRVRGNLVAISKWAQGGSSAPVPGSPTGHARRLTVRFWLRPVEILGTERVEGITLERTAIAADGAFGGTGEFETLSAQMVLRSVGYQSVPLPGVPFDPRASVVPNALGRVLGEDGSPLPGEYVAGWLKRGPTGVIGTNKSDAAETIRCLLEDLAGGPGEGDVPLPRAGLLRYPDRPAPAADNLVQPADPALPADPSAPAFPPLPILPPRPPGSGRWPACSPDAGSCRSPTPNGCASRPRKPTWPRRWAGASGSSCTTPRRSGPPAAPPTTNRSSPRNTPTHPRHAPTHPGVKPRQFGQQSGSTNYRGRLPPL